MMVHEKTLAEKYPPSQPCSCEICLSYCQRPGWWTVDEAAKAIEAGYAGRMMLEMSPDRSFAVLAPAFKGCETEFALERCAGNGCNFLKDNLCELHGTGFQPLECRFCHHDRRGLGPKCHAALEQDWNTPAGRSMVVTWSKLTGFYQRHVPTSLKPQILSYDDTCMSNLIYLADNLPILQSMPSESVDLIYIDPPFNTGKTQARTQIRTERSENGDRVGF